MASTIRIALIWDAAPARGEIEVIHGTLAGIKAIGPKAKTKGNAFALAAGQPARVEIAIADAITGVGAGATRVQVRAKGAGQGDGFAFFLRDVLDEAIVIAPLGVAIGPASDRRDYRQIDAAVRDRGLVSDLQRIESEPEVGFTQACAHARDLIAPTWLGIGRDMRFFSVSFDRNLGYWGGIEPRYHSSALTLPESEGRPVSIGYAVGRGAMCEVDLTRRLDEGTLPILTSIQRDGPVEYRLTMFATLERSPLTPASGRVRGTHYVALLANSGGNMLLPHEKELYEKELKDAETHHREEETVCWARIEAVNTSPAPRHAWFRAAQIQRCGSDHDGAHGFGKLKSGRVYSINLIDGKPMPQLEMAVLLPAGGTCTMDVLVPHEPMTELRAVRLAKQDYTAHLAGARAHWRGKLAVAAKANVPECAIRERISAGLLHVDLQCYGLEPKGTLAPCVGWYSPIGSESSPMIQFLDSAGCHDIARRSLQFFFDHQREDGFIQTFGGYQLETGPVLWTAGEHYRYTRDDAWARRVRPNVLKACDYLLKWRERNKRDELRGNGYGLLDGKVADPEDFFHSYMLNGLSYAGIARAAELLAKVDPANARRLAKEAAAFRADIRTAYFESLARAPVVPTGDGTWVPSFSPWTEYPGPLALYAEGGNWNTHGAFGARDSLIGALYLVIGEVLDPCEPAVEWMLKAHHELFTHRAAAFTQPYYVRHDDAHLRRGEVKPFLSLYYHQVAALQDRQSYTFWEHYHHASPHKTHEEGWFLMQTRWMLYREDGDALRLLPAVPRQWLSDGKTIDLRDWASYFGRISLRVESRLSEGRIEASVKVDPKRGPSKLLLRLPHPENRRAIRAEGGSYDAASETVVLTPKAGEARVVLRF